MIFQCCTKDKFLEHWPLGSVAQPYHLNSMEQQCHFHVSDSIPGNELRDANRVFPGDGSAPLPDILNDLKQINPEMMMSLELFNPVYWKMDALKAASTGLKKIKEMCQPEFPS